MSPGEPDAAASSTQPTSTQPSARQQILGRLLVVAACLLWSTNGFFVKWPVFDSWPAETRGVTLAFWRSVFAILVLAPLVRRVAWNWRMAPMAIGFVGMSVTFLTSMVFTTAGNAIWLQNTAPLWVLCSSRWIYREPFDRRNRVPLVTGLLGAALIIGCETSAQLTPRAIPGVLLGTVSGLFYAAVIVSMRRLREWQSTWLIVFNLLVTVGCLAPYVLLYCPWPEGIQWPVLIGFGVLQLGTPYVLFAEGLKRIGSQEAAAVGLIEPVLVPIWVFWYWDEKSAWWTIAGGALILSGLAWRYLRRTPAA